MKKIPNQQARPATTLCIIFICLLLPFFSNGQTWVTPTHARNFIGAIGPNPHLNCANLTYDPGAPGTTGQLSVICWDNSNSVFAPAPGFIIMDGKGHSHLELHPSYANAKLDIIIGNAIITNGGPGYRVGVVYLSGHSVNLDLYDVLNPGTAALTTSFVTTITIASSSHTYNDPHIDVIAEYADTHILGLPYCSKFVITYSDVNSTTFSSYIQGYKRDLNLGPIVTNTIATGSWAPNHFLQMPDVAGIQINSTSGIQDYARFAYVDNNYNVEELEWNITTNTIAVAGSVVMTAPSAVSPNNYGYYYPRIDGIDNYASSMTSGQANYQIISDLVYQQFITSGTPPVTVVAYNYYINGYNDNAGFIKFSSPYMDLYNNVSPCVAAGPMNQYTSCYFTSHPNSSGLGGLDIAQTVDFATGLLSGSNLYQIDSFGQTTGDTGSYLRSPLCVSTSFNDTRYNLVAWCNNLTDLFYKFTGSPISFKSNNNPLASGDFVQISPNPADNYLIVNEDGSFIKYQVTDMSGRKLLSGNLNDNRNQINIDKLSPGIYLLDIYKTNGEFNVAKFIKQ